MKKRELIQLLVGLSYSTGYEQAQKDAEIEARHQRELEVAYRKGRMAEAKAKGDTRRTVDLMGAADE